MTPTPEREQDAYFRAGIQRSMEEPFRTYTRVKRKSYIPMARVERRSRWLKRWWMNHHEDVGLVAWSVFVFIAFVEVVLIYGIR